MSGAIKINGKYEMVRIVSIPTFTYEGAVEAYKKSVKMIYDKETKRNSSQQVCTFLKNSEKNTLMF